MEQLVGNLQKRRRMMFYIVAGIAFLGVAIDTLFEIEAVTYFDATTRMDIVYLLISYKIIELCILYIVFYHRHMRHYLVSLNDEQAKAKFDKNAKRFFMLVPHGSVIFGIIAYKMTADVEFFLLFLTIAFVALYMVNPKKIHQKLK